MNNDSLNDKSAPSLRTQIIDAIGQHQGWEESAVALFDEAIMPVLQKAMDAGQLLVGRNTGPRIPVHKAVITFLQGMTNFRNRVRDNEAVVSKRELLTMIYTLGDNADRALKDAARTEQVTH